jgi:hypothetical protein
VILNLELDKEKEILAVYSYIGEVPLEGRENTFETFLKSNFPSKNTQWARLGIDKHTQTVVLAYPMELPLKIKVFLRGDRLFLLKSLSNGLIVLSGCHRRQKLSKMKNDSTLRSIVYLFYGVLE